jgi:DNA-damage-inducible protein J
MSTQTLNVKVDSELKAQFAEFAKSVGLTTSALVTMFMKRSVDDQELPFLVKSPNRPKRFDELNPIIQKLWIEDKAIEMELIEDDSTEFTPEYWKKMEDLYK